MSRNIDVVEFNRRLNSGEHFTIIDVRTKLEYSRGHIPGAINVPLGNALQELQLTELTSPIAVVCQSGHRSTQACRVLASHCSDIFNVAGGTAAWKAAGFSIARSSRPQRSTERQAHLIAGVLLLAALSLHQMSDERWIYLAALPAFGLLLDAITGFCPMTWLLARAPWNHNYGTS